MPQDYKLTPEQEQELDTMVLEMEQDNLPEADIATVVQNYMSEASGKAQELEIEESPTSVPNGDLDSNLEDSSSESQVPLAAEAIYAFGAGLAGLVSGTGRLGAGLQLTIGELFNPELAAELKENPEVRNALYDNIFDQMALASTAEDVSESLLENVESDERGITGAIGEGDYGAAAEETVRQVAQALPSLIATATGVGGMVVLGTSAAGSAFDETIEEFGDEDATKILGTSLLKGGYEFVSEFATRGILKRAGLVFGKSGEKAAKEYAESAFKRIMKDFNVEGLSEAGSEFASAVTDSVAYGKELDGSLLNTLADTYIVGGIVGGGASTIGQLNSGNRKAVENLTEPNDKIEADKKAAAVMNTTVDAQKTAGGPEDLSILTDTFNQEKEALQKRQEEHKRTVDDMTGEETIDIVKNKSEVNKIEKALENPNNTPEISEVYEAKIKQLEDKIDEIYTVVKEWPATMEKADAIKEEIEEKRKDLNDQKKTLAQSENPNPASTRKIKKAEKELKEKEDGLNKALDEARPTHSEAKTRKRKGKVKPKEVDKTVAKPIRDKQQRTEANEDLIQTIQDPNIPDSQKERAYSNFFKVNAPLVTSIANTAKNKSYSSRSVSEIRDLVKTEIAKRIGEGSKVDNKLYNNAAKAVERLIKQEDTTVRSPRKESIKEELREIDQQVLDGILDAEAAEILKDDIRAEQEQAITGGFNTTEEGEVILPESIEAVYPEEATDTEKQQIETVLKEAGGVDKLLNEIQSNTDKIFALLPAKAKSGKAFSGIFSNGNPPVEIWDSYFDQSDRQGKDRVRQLKKAINERLKDVTDPDITPGLEFQEAQKGVTGVKTFLPLLGKLKRAFPGVKVIISKGRMIEDFIEAGIDPGKADGVKGYTDGKTVVLNPEKLDLETPIHEFGHIWAQATRSERPELYQKGVELVKKSPYWLELQEKAKDPDSVYYNHSTTRLEEEAIATAIGQSGSQFYDQASDASAWDKLRGQILDWLSKRLGIAKIEDLTFDQFLKIASTEIITGKKVIKPEDVVAVTNPDSQLQELDFHVYGTGPGYGQADTVGGKLKQALLEILTTGGVTLLGDNVFRKDVADFFRGKDKSLIRDHEKASTELVAANEALKKDETIYNKVRFDSALREYKSAVAKLEDRNISFLEAEAPSKDKVLQDLLNLKGKNVYKDGSPYKRSKVDQKTREIIEATRRDFALRGHALTPEGRDILIANLTNLIEKGWQKQLAKKEFSKQKKEFIESTTNDLIGESVGKDLSDLTPREVEVLSKERDKYINNIGVSKGLAPVTNNDFYGLLYYMFPKGKSRKVAKDFVDTAVTKVLEFANYNQTVSAMAMRNNWTDLKENSGITNKDLNKRSKVVLAGAPLTNGQVVKAYNWIKDPSLYNQMEAGGIDAAKMEQILDYLDANPKLKTFADGVPGIYSGVRQQLNSKLDQHGYKGVSEGAIIKPKDAAYNEILHRVYGNNIPVNASYTPFTAKGAEDYIADLESKIEGDDANYYTVMSGNLKKRTGGGAVDLSVRSLQQEVDSYIKGPLRTMNFLDFAKNASGAFSQKNLKAMEAAYGTEYSKSMKDALRRIITGRNVPTNEPPAVKAVRGWLNNTVGGIMFFNVRSSVLQLISTANYAVDNPGAYFKGIASKRKSEAMKMILESAWYKERGKGKAELELSEIFAAEGTGTWQKGLQKLLESGYALTRLGDKSAIALGGAPFVAGLLEQGATPEDAMRQFIAQSEEAQQSTRPERLGREQVSTFGRALLAFANTPMQYNRKMAKAFKDVQAGENVAHNVGRIAYYGAMQNAIFTFAQQMAFAALDLEDEDEKDKVLNAVNSMTDTILRGSGIIGAAIATSKNIVRAIYATKRKDKKSEKAIQALISASPALGNKARQLQRAIKDPYPQSAGAVEVPAMVARAANATAFVTNVPADRALRLLEQANDMTAKDLNTLEKIGRGAGWGRWELGKTVQKKEEEYINPYDSPLHRNEDGQAFKDGTIEIDPNLSPEEREKTIAHEMQHVKDMEEKGLDYDDDYVYYDGQKHARKDGKIEFNGKMLPEGDNSLPWEARAHNAESPFKRRGKKKKKEGKTHEQQRAMIGTPSTFSDRTQDPRRPEHKRRVANQSRIRERERSERNAVIEEENYIRRFEREDGRVDLGEMIAYEHEREGGYGVQRDPETGKPTGYVSGGTVWGLGGATKSTIAAAGKYGKLALKTVGLLGNADDTNFVRERYDTAKDHGSPFKRTSTTGRGISEKEIREISEEASKQYNVPARVLRDTIRNEGFRGQAYADQIGIPTIGYGQTYYQGGGSVELGDTISQRDATGFLAKRTAKDRKYVEKYLKDMGYDANPNQIDALTQFSYNLGKGTLKSLTKDGKRSLEEIGQKIQGYDWAGGKQQKFLTDRRNEEAGLFNREWARKSNEIKPEKKLKKSKVKIKSNAKIKKKDANNGSKVQKTKKRISLPFSKGRK